MNRKIFRRLYSQIVIPLVAAAVVVGVLATVVAVYFLSDLTDNWVDEVAYSVSRNLMDRMDVQSDFLLGVARLVADNPDLTAAMRSGDFAEVQAVLESSGPTANCDGLAIVDLDGRVVASSCPGIGDSMPGPGGQAWSALELPATTFLEMNGGITLTAATPVQGPEGDRPHVLLASDTIDEEFLRAVGVGAGCGSGFYSEGLMPIAWSVPQWCDAESARMSPEDVTAAFSGPAPGILSALNEAAVSGEGASVIDVSDIDHRVVAHRVDLPGSPTHGFLVALISQRVSEEARTTTTSLIAMWSVVAVLALVGLGGWVARRVSEPLVSLTEGAQRIADGDFSTRIAISGRNEIADLAENFNQMTESLRDRSESLTKKVLELATLYEMSRALGATLELEQLLDSVLESALRIFGADVGYVTMRNKESATLEILARSGAVPGRVDDRALRTSMSEWVIREARPLIFNPSDDGSEHQVEVVTGAMAALCVPLVSSEGTIGAITIGSQDPEFRFGSDDVRLLSTIANHVTIAIGNIDLFSSLQDAYLTTVRSLAVAVDAKDPYTRGHSEGVALYAAMIAEQMGLSHDQRIAIEMAAYLHDIGKIGIKEEILLKPGRLTDEEMAQMRHHPLIGANILKPVAFPWPIVPVVRHHHERWDGGGYPAGLKGEEIPLLARILTVADAYEAMISHRPYRRGRTAEEAITELERCSGEQFDSAVVDALITALRDEAAAQALEGHAGVEDDVVSEEARAIFVALCEGMFVSFRRLGGPRLAGNAETELNKVFDEMEIPVTVRSGRVVADFDRIGADRCEIEQMRDALRLFDRTIGSLSGHSLVDHFYADAASSLSERMRRIAVRLGFFPS